MIQFSLLRNFPFVGIPEGVNTGEFYILEPVADRPQVRILPHADIDVIIVNDLLDLVEQLLALCRIGFDGLLVEQFVELRITVPLIICTIRIIGTHNLIAFKDFGIRIGVRVLDSGILGDIVLAK